MILDIECLEKVQKRLTNVKKIKVDASQEHLFGPRGGKLKRSVKTLPTSKILGIPPLINFPKLRP